MADPLYAAVSGLNAEQTFMSVVAQNIANVNTVGYKAGSVSFAEALQQTTQGATAPTAVLGGTNPIQVTAGGAVNVEGNQINMAQGSLQSTGINTDLAIQGNGFFIVETPQGLAYTRAGNFSLDANGNLVDPAGDKVLGWAGSTPGTKATLTPLTVPENGSIAPKATAAGTLTGNLSQTSTGVSVPITVYNPVGTAESVTLTFSPTATAGSTPVYFNSAGTPLAAPQAGGTTWYVSATATIPPATTGGSSTTQALTVNANGSTLSLSGFPAGWNMPGAVAISYGQMTNFASASTLQATTDGNASGTLASFNFNGTGQIVGTYSNGQTQVLGQVALAAFANPAGLNNIGQNLWQSSPNSGRSQVGVPGTGQLGTVAAGQLEESNVNLSQEFVNLIVAQQGYEGNTKVLTVDQTLNQSLIAAVQ